MVEARGMRFFRGACRAPDAWQLRHAFRILARKRRFQQAEPVVERRALN
jgi:hypothetical protein